MEPIMMDPTWGAIEDALDPQRRETLMRLLAGKRGIDPGSTPIGGLPNEEVPWKLRPVGSAIPEPVTAPPAPADPGVPPDRAKMMADILGAARAGAVPSKAKLPTIYETPYGAELRAADEEAKKANNDYDRRATRYNQGRLAQLADSYVSRKIALKERGATTEPMSIYDTPYGEQIRTAEEKLKKARGYQVKPALEDRDHFTRLAERHIARTEGVEEHWDSVGAKERAAENELIAAVLGGSDKDQEGIRKERIAKMLARSKRFTRGTPMDRGEDGVWQQVTDNETGESTWEEAPVPAKRKAPAVHGLGSGGGVYFDQEGRPQRIEPFRAPSEPKDSPTPKPQQVPAAILSAVTARVLENVDPEDPEALARALGMLRGLLPGALPNAPAPPPSPAEVASMTHAAPARAPLAGRVGGPAKTATDPRTGRKVMWNGQSWVPFR